MMNVFRRMPNMVSEDSGEELRVEHVDITGTALGWVPLADDPALQTMKITPTYSYIAKLKLENGERLFRMFEIPRLQKYAIFEE